jgi:transcription antitermination protein NusB
VDSRSDAGTPGRRPVGHRRRRAARRAAIDILYEADLVGRPASSVLEEWRSAGRDVPGYAEEVVAAVWRDLEALDALLGANAEGWAVHRMAAVDRTILRVASYEIRSGVPPAVAINEAVEAANELSTADSGRFINGVLGRIAREIQDGEAQREEDTR